MTLPAFKKSYEHQEAWKTNNPEMLKKSQQSLEEIKKNSTPFIDTRDLPESERRILELENENKSLLIKVAELYTEAEEAYELLRIAAQKRRYALPVKQLKGFLDFINGNEFIYATFDSNTNVLEHLSKD